MKKNKINMVTGYTYTLAELFSDNRKVIIPDYQRDYCWGNTTHIDGDTKQDLVSNFVYDLIEMFEEGKTDNMNLGLIYGYEMPEEHIQLCDGQQRITTLYLLLGMLNRRSGINAFRRQLISDYEYEQDDKEPYLQYAIRESSLYFLSDLVCRFFITKDDDTSPIADVGSITKCPWFFNDYNNNPSIQSMLKALKTIESTLKVKDAQWCKQFGDFLIHRLSFLYYDLDNRQNGEKTFVVINTTGEPLSATQNLKPLICAESINKDYHKLSEKWEEIETWFWSKRRKGNGNDTADAGFNEFLRWVTILHLNANEDKEQQQKILSEGVYTFPRTEISFVEIEHYWEQIKFLFEEWGKDYMSSDFLSPETNREMKDIKAIKQIDCFLLLPLMAYCKKWGVSDTADRNLYRLYMFLLNLRRLDQVRSNVNNLVSDAIKIAVECRDITELVDKGEELKISETILTKEEKQKLDILKNNPSQRIEIEEAFWKVQDDKEIPCHKIWNGQILPLIKWASLNNAFDLQQFEKYADIFDHVFGSDGQGGCCGNGNKIIDSLRRALLTRGLNGYPRIFKGYTVYSLGWDWGEWKILINDNMTKFKEFFDDLLQGENYDQRIAQMIADYTPKDEYYDLVHDEKLIDYCGEKKLQKAYNAWFLMKKARWSAQHVNIHTYKFYCYLQQYHVPEGYKCALKERSVIFEKTPLTIEIQWNTGMDNRQVGILLRPLDNTDEEFAKSATDKLKEKGYEWDNDKREGCKYIDMADDNLDDRVKSEIDNFLGYHGEEL